MAGSALAQSSAQVPVRVLDDEPVTLICLAHAGGSALLYRQWLPHLASAIQLHPLDLPGRGTRITTPALTQWPALIDTLADQCLSELDGRMPFALFGHSLGALVGFELLCALEARDGRKPLWFGASACIAPELRKLDEHWIDCGVDEMAARLRELGGTPEELLEDTDFMDFMWPVLRADFHLSGTYPHFLRSRRELHASWRLGCPVDVFVGNRDAATADASAVAGWSAHTDATCTVRRFDAGHFFVNTHAPAVIETMTHALGVVHSCRAELDLTGYRPCTQ
ncbi:thioesterase II family protein [Paraburkholderia humisilvae]|uniref:Linear gramicidin dehydrogenase LgrE n=1 Tax=Paraburkholderia humisilvae TaxID=627669 RepID=A0A6J5F266_9BURK|nr:alpha/beta fold hydrolase [Paraburkholderia humisilvae]CAB3771791.1 Linear gramicidin dehydrogenase LgrE [Paraburkholderia humisilvae]